MSGLSQIQASYSEREDRILLRLNTANREEFRFWLTRRFISRMFPVFQQTFEEIPEIASQETQHNRQTIMAFQRENARQKVDFEAPFSEEAQTYPLGNQALLVVKGKLAPKPNGDFMLSMQDENNIGIDFNLNRDILYLLQSLLQQTMDKAKWQIQLGMPDLINETKPAAHQLN